MDPKVKYWYDKFIAMGLDSEEAELCATLKMECQLNHPKNTKELEELLDNMPQKHIDRLKELGILLGIDIESFFRFPRR